MELMARLDAARSACSDERQRDGLRQSLADHDAIAELAIRAEFLAGMPSPEVWREQRRAHQMARLAEKLGGGAALKVEGETASLWREWLALAGSGSPSRANFDARIEAALAQWFDGT